MSIGAEGAILGDRYKLTRLRHQGDTIEHWDAVDSTLGRTVLVIVVAGETVPATLDAARRLSVVTDARLCRVLDVGTFDRDGSAAAFVVHEDLVGHSIADMTENGPLTAEVARTVIGEVASALERAAAVGLHHGCLTPHHILQTEAGDLRIIGTAIEAAAGGFDDADPQATARLDACDLVAVLYHALTTHDPTDPLVGPSDLVSSVPADLDTLCSVTLGPHDDGPMNPAELAKELTPWGRIPASIVKTGILTGVKVPAPAAIIASADAQTAALPRVEPAPELAAESTEGTPVAAPPQPVAANTTQAPTQAADDVALDGDADESTPDATTEDQARLTEESEVYDITADERASSADGKSQPATGYEDREAKDSHSHAPQTPRTSAVRDSLPVAGAAAAAVAADPVPQPISAPAGAWEMFDTMAQRTVRQSTPATFAAGSVEEGSTSPGWTNSPATMERPEEQPPFEQVVGTHGYAVSPRGYRTSRNGIVALSVLAAGAAVCLVIVVFSLIINGQSAEDVQRRTAPPTIAVPDVEPSKSADDTKTKTTSSELEEIALTDVESLDPKGGDGENDTELSAMIDGVPTTFWPTSTYGSQAFGGLKDGVGAILELPADIELSEIRITERGSGGSMNVRLSSSPTAEGGQLVDTFAPDGTEHVVELDEPSAAEYLILWYTQLPKATDGGWRGEIAEVKVLGTEQE